MDIRDDILNSLVAEVVGPSLQPRYTDESGQEILLTKIHGTPKSRYGAGMLYPQQTVNIEELDDPEHSTASDDPITETDKRTKLDEGNRNSATTESGAVDEEPVGLANQYLPSAMGFTIRFRNGEKEDQIMLTVKSARYVKGVSQKEVRKVTSEGKSDVVMTKDGPMMSDYWIRVPINIEPISLDLNHLTHSSYSQILTKTEKNKDWLKLQVFNRTSDDDEESGYLTFTFVIVNCLRGTTNDSVSNSDILFQNELILNTQNTHLIAPYREKVSNTDTFEERELQLLYRKKRVFGIGHGCSVKWNSIRDSSPERVSEVSTSIIPVFDIPQVAPTSHIELEMFAFSDKGSWANASLSLRNLAMEYESWIQGLENIIDHSPELKNYEDAAKTNILKCRISLERIKHGISLLTSQPESSNLVKAFKWMNRAMIWQQQRSKIKQRKWIRVKRGKLTEFQLEDITAGISKPESLEEFSRKSSLNGRWRPFQLAFILMNLESIVNPSSTERGVIDLIWFPTGGGKTEAYLGLTALTIFYRRLKGQSDFNWSQYGGTVVLMRYTLRLLTTQQYERAASLICACDLIRKENLTQLGDEPISIGLWVGGKSTPNDHVTAKSQFNSLTVYKFEQYNFIVLKCPCCGTQIGKIENATREDKIKIKGLRKEDGKHGKIIFQCENDECEYFSEPLPLTVVDEYIYERPPTLLLGTVDKFAMLPWKREFQIDSKTVDTSSLFGFRQKQGGEWTRISPPELIIQDELHLIAGPLGTMVGLYETLVQTLCNNYGISSPPFFEDIKSKFTPPKLIASSATISRAYEQVRSLYAIDDRNRLHIFPSQGLEFGNTWFSEEKSTYETDAEGKSRYPGRRYVGILASGFPSAQTSIVRTYSSVLQKVKELDTDGSIDYYWTLLGYFNSIRELGGASSLVFGDIRERLTQIQNRELTSFDRRRKLFDWKIQELTSRINSAEIPEVLKKLEEGFRKSNNLAIDICLATNMVATGVDISRLGLMFIHGQPKTTAEYIQASSRVGRSLPNGPGLVVILYSPSKPRDKSQYEQFQGYHSRIYSYVEPTSVTPFSINARERALHAIFIGLLRHFSSGPLRKNARTDALEFDDLCKRAREIILARCLIVDKDEVKNTELLLDRIIGFWKAKGFQHYGDAGNFAILNSSGYFPLMYANSSEVKEEIVIEKKSLATPTSMRGVDTESRISI